MEVAEFVVFMNKSIAHIAHVIAIKTALPMSKNNQREHKYRPFFLASFLAL
jgi:hypothetical protein